MCAIIDRMRCVRFLNFDFTFYVCLQHAPPNYFLPDTNQIPSAPCLIVGHVFCCCCWHCTMCDAIRFCFAAYIADDLKWLLNFCCFHFIFIFRFHRHASHAMALERLLPLSQWHKEIWCLWTQTFFVRWYRHRCSVLHNFARMSPTISVNNRVPPIRIDGIFPVLTLTALFLPTQKQRHLWHDFIFMWHSASNTNRSERFCLFSRIRIFLFSQFSFLSSVC